VIRRLFHGIEARDATLQHAPDWMFEAFGGTRTHAGTSVNTTSVLGLDALWAAVTLLAGSVAQCPLIVYRGEGRTRERARDTWQWNLLHNRPNAEHPADLFYENIVGHENLFGNFYAEKVKARRTGSGDSFVGELWPIVPSRVTVERDNHGGKRFRVDGSSDTYGPETILHIPAFGYDGLKGLSPIEASKQTLGTALAREEFEGGFYSRGAVLSGMIEHPAKLGDSAIENLRKSVNAIYGGRGQQHKVGVLEEGATLRTLSPPMKDLEFVAGKQLTVSQIARIFRVPPEMIGGERAAGSLTYATVEGQALHFVKFSLSRWLVRIEQALKHDPDLFPPGTDLYPEFLVEGLLRGDSKTRGEFYKVMWDMKAITTNEIRERENMTPLEGGDDFPAENVPAPDEGATRELATALMETRERVRDLEQRERPAPTFHIDATTTIEDGAIRQAPITVEAPPPAEVRFEAGAIDARTDVAEGAIRADTHVHVPAPAPVRRTVQYDDDGRVTGSVEEPITEE
jgi:HK97 family phage portal protein